VHQTLRYGTNFGFWRVILGASRTGSKREKTAGGELKGCPSFGTEGDREVVGKNSNGHP
jgi:hypothetical protein